MGFTKKLLYSAVLLLASGLLHSAADTETVLVRYHAKPGSEAQLQSLLDQTWRTLRKLNLALESPHVLVRGADDAGKPYFVEIFTWKDHDAPDHAPQEVQTLWTQLESLCEPRAGRRGIDIAEVDLVTPGK